jgi:hypothetical protein
VASAYITPISTDPSARDFRDALWFAKIPNMLRMRDLRLTPQVLNQMT